MTGTTRPPGRSALLLVAGIPTLALASRVAIPLDPVPVTAQTLAVTVIGALYGSRLGAVTVLVWLGLAALGAPLLVEGASGIARFTGSTGGYLIAFPFAAAMVGALVAGSRHDFLPILAVMMLGNALCLAVGGAWLAASIGAPAAWAKGVLPFLPGALLKSLAGAAIIWAVQRATSSRNAATSVRSTE